MPILNTQPPINFILSTALRGAPGATGAQGIQGIPGINGTNGLPGLGVPVGGSAGQYLVKNSSTNYDAVWASMPMTTSANINTVAQAAHGFTVGQILKVGASSYSVAQASSPTVADVVGMVFSVINANSFTLLTEGYIMGLSGLTAGAVYFLSPTTGGAMTTVEPVTAGQVRKPLFTADSATSGYFHNYEGVLIGSASYGGGGGGGGATQNVAIATANYTATDTDDIIVQTFLTGTVTMQNPATAKVKPYTIANQSGGVVSVLATSINGAVSFPVQDGESITILPVSSNFIII